MNICFMDWRGGIGDMLMFVVVAVRAEISNQAESRLESILTLFSLAQPRTLSSADWFNRQDSGGTAWRWTSTFMFHFNCHHQLRRRRRRAVCCCCYVFVLLFSCTFTMLLLFQLFQMPTKCEIAITPRPSTLYSIKIASRIFQIGRSTHPS